MKQTVTAEIVARIDEINGIINTKQPGMTLEELMLFMPNLMALKESMISLILLLRRMGKMV